MPQVTMNLTDKDVENADRIHDYLETRNRAHAVSIALSLGAWIAGQVASGGKVLIQDRDGSVSQMKMAELDRTT